MLALAHDFRVMRADRGFFCLPEVDINIPFTPGMAALIQARLAPKAAHEAMTTGRRYGGADAAAADIVDAAVPLEEVLPAALALVRPLAAKNPQTLHAIKSGMYPTALNRPPRILTPRESNAQTPRVPLSDTASLPFGHSELSVRAGSETATRHV